MTLTALSGNNFEMLFQELQTRLINSPVVATGQWQSRDISGIDALATPELANVSFSMTIPGSQEVLADVTGARLPWAEDHFQERVGGVPLNPAPSEAWWPFAQKVNRDHKSEEGGKFSHTYPERMWPKWADIDMSREPATCYKQHKGIRFNYGDLADVVKQLEAAPLTRQAYLPLWFPEDTGAVHGKRVPCTLGYHFMIREGKLQVTYYMRSCDFIRHFQDDVYMAGRLAQWVVEMIKEENPEVELEVGELIMHIASLHCFVGDLPMMNYRNDRGLSWDV